MDFITLLPIAFPAVVLNIPSGAASPSMLTGLVLTLNEEIHIGRCLASLRPCCDRLVVIDSGSSDRTVEIARSLGAEVLVHPFVNQAEQVNWALAQLDQTSGWVFRLDADEFLLAPAGVILRRCLESAPDSVSGFEIRRRYIFWGSWIRFGGCYPGWVLRIWRAGHGRSERRQMDEHIVLTTGGHARLPIDIADENLHGLAYWVDKHNGYSSREVLALQTGASVEAAAQLAPQARRRRWLKTRLYLRGPAYLRALAYWAYRYFFLCGFLDGRAGLVFHALQGGWYRFLVDAKIEERRRLERRH